MRCIFYKLLRTAGNIGIVVVFSTVMTVWGDVVRLKSGGTIEGIITGVNNGVVTMNVGFGTTSVDSADISSVSRSGKKQNSALKKVWKDRGAVKNAPTAPGLLLFIDKVRTIRALRVETLERQRELERLGVEIDSLEHTISEQVDGYQAISPDLGAIDRKDYREQYRLVGQAHQYNSSIIHLGKLIEEKNADLQRGNPVLSEYLDSVTLAEQAFRAFKKKCAKKILCDNRDVLRDLEGDFQKYKSEFKTAVTDATFIQGNHILVPVSINGRPPVYLLLDTGASSVTLSRALADRLGIAWQNGVKVMATLADGRKTEGYSVIVKSVAVNDFRTANVRAVVLDQPPAKDIDGLLGMSYLQRFILRIDPMKKKVVLKRISAR